MADPIAPTTPTPSPAPTPTPTPAPAPAPTKTADPFAAIDTKPPAKAAPATPPEKGKETPPAKPAGDDGKPAPAAAAPDKKLASKVPPEMRQRIDEQNAQITALRQERDDVRRQLQEAQTKGGGDSKALLTQIESLQKEVKRYQGQLAAKDYTQHPDFKKSYEQPFLDAADNARNIIESLEVTEGDGTRKADWSKDFGGLYSMPRSAARVRAKELFGEDAATVMQQYDDLHRLDSAKSKALKDYESTSEQREQQTRAEKLQQQESVGKAFTSATNDFVESKPEHFREDPADPEGSELLKKGFSLVDPFYFSRDKLTPQELLIGDAAIRLRAAAFPRMERALATLKQENEELKAALNEKGESTSGRVRRGGDKTDVPTEKDWRQDFRESVPVVPG